jgi:hypothetical protein
LAGQEIDLKVQIRGLSPSQSLAAREIHPHQLIYFEKIVGLAIAGRGCGKLFPNHGLSS